MTYPTAVHSAWQFTLVESWCAGVAYKPGTRISPVYHDRLGTIQVKIEALLFDSTRPSATKVLRNQSINVPYGGPVDLSGDWMSEQAAYYAAGPDLVAGPLLRIAKSSEVPLWMDLPTPETRKAEVAEAHTKFVIWLQTQLHELERHESDEWFRDAQTGRPFFDPHAPLPPSPSIGEGGR